MFQIWKIFKSIFEFILVWTPFKFSLKMFKTILFELKILEINLKIKSKAHLLESLFLAQKRLASPAAKLAHSAEPARLAHLPGPSSTSHPSCRRPSPSRTQTELNQTAAQPPSLSCTSSAPQRLPSPIQCWNHRVKIHRRRPPPTPHLASHNPMNCTAHHPLLPHNPLPHSSSFLSVPSFMPARRSCRRFASPLPAYLGSHCHLKPQVSFASLPSPSFSCRSELFETVATGSESSGELLSYITVSPPWTAARLLVHCSVSPAHQFF
jgi:hypothetical protein